MGMCGLVTAQPVIAATFASLGQTPGQVATGTALDSFSGSAASASGAMLSAVGSQSTAAGRADALGQLSPQSYTLLPRLVIQSLDAKDAMTQSYLADRRNGSNGSSAVKVGGRGDINMILLGDIRGAKYDGAPDRPKVGTDSRSIAFGIDYAAREGVILGVMVGIDGLDAKLDPRRPRITLFNSHIGAYGSVTNGRVYVTGMATYDYGDFKLRREIDFANFSDRLSGTSKSDGWAVTGETGYRLKAGRATIEPYASLNWRNVGMSGIAENGGAAALQVAKYRTRSLQSGLGARLSTAVPVKGGWTLRPTAQAEWRHELRSHPDSRIDARFASGDFSTFTLQPNTLSRNYASVSAGVTASYHDRTSFRIAYDGQLASDRRVHGLFLSVSRRF